MKILCTPVFWLVKHRMQYGQEQFWPSHGLGYLSFFWSCLLNDLLTSSPVPVYGTTITTETSFYSSSVLSLLSFSSYILALPHPSRWIHLCPCLFSLLTKFLLLSVFLSFSRWGCWKRMQKNSIDVSKLGFKIMSFVGTNLLTFWSDCDLHLLHSCIWLWSRGSPWNIFQDTYFGKKNIFSSNSRLSL